MFGKYFYNSQFLLFTLDLFTAAYFYHLAPHLPCFVFQQIFPPQELYCSEEFANFVRLAILPPPPNAHLIDIKPHAHFGSKQARAAAREKAAAR